MSFRVWPALASWGAGLIHFAVAAAAPLPLLVAFAALGAAEFAWGVASLRANRVVLPRTTLIVAVAALAASVAVALAGVMAWLPLLCSSVMVVFVAAAAALVVRRRSQGRVAAASAPAPARPGRTLAGFVAGAALVAALTTPALAATDAGQYAVPHGEMPGHHGH